MIAIGSKTDQELVSKLGLKLNKWGSIKVNEKHQTSNSKVFAGGDLAGDKATVAYAARAGRDSAKEIINFIYSK